MPLVLLSVASRQELARDLVDTMMIFETEFETEFESDIFSKCNRGIYSKTIGWLIG